MWINCLNNKLLITLNNYVILDGTNFDLPNITASIVRSWTNIAMIKDNEEKVLRIFENETPSKIIFRIPYNPSNLMLFDAGICQI